jgi:hypothetical protein
MDDDDRQDLFGVVAAEMVDAFGDILGKAEDLIVLAEGSGAHREEAARLIGRLAEDWALKLRKVTILAGADGPVEFRSRAGIRR